MPQSAAGPPTKSSSREAEGGNEMIGLLHALSAMPPIRFFDLIVLVGWIVMQPTLWIIMWRAR